MALADAATRGAVAKRRDSRQFISISAAVAALLALLTLYKAPTITLADGVVMRRKMVEEIDTAVETSVVLATDDDGANGAVMAAIRRFAASRRRKRCRSS